MGIIERMNREESSKLVVDAIDTNASILLCSNALIGVSMGNSYFRKATVNTLIDDAHQNFELVLVMCPDAPYVHTLIAKGKSPDDAERKSRLATNSIKNGIRRSLDALGQSACIVDWSDENQGLEKQRSYQEYLHAFTSLFQTHEAFQQEVLHSTETVIAGADWNELGVAEQKRRLDIGKNFLLMELACIFSVHTIIPSNLSIYIYHRPMPILKKLLDGKFGDLPQLHREKTGFLMYEGYEA